ncbi:hypothetical protein ACNI3R_19855 [Rhizorhabdus sp. FW153]
MRAWLISNLASGSTDAATLDQLPALFPTLDFVGHSCFPDAPLTLCHGRSRLAFLATRAKADSRAEGEWAA